MHRIDESLCRVDDNLDTDDSAIVPYDRCDTRATEAGQAYISTYKCTTVLLYCFAVLLLMYRLSLSRDT